MVRVVGASPADETRRRKRSSRGSGPHRSPDAHRDILQATWDLLSEVGYQSLTIEGVAASANVGKATIYRWWPSKGPLVAEAIAVHLSTGPNPSSGDTQSELREAIDAAIKNYSGTVAGVALPALLADLVYDDESYQRFFQAFLEPRRETSKDVLRRAIVRGDLPVDANLELILDMWAGAIFYRVLISRQPVTEDLVDELTTLILDGCRARTSTPVATKTKSAPKSPAKSKTKATSTPVKRTSKPAAAPSPRRIADDGRRQGSPKGRDR